MYEFVVDFTTYNLLVCWLNLNLVFIKPMLKASVNYYFGNIFCNVSGPFIVKYI